MNCLTCELYHNKAATKKEQNVALSLKEAVQWNQPPPPGLSSWEVKVKWKC